MLWEIIAYTSQSGKYYVLWIEMMNLTQNLIIYHFLEALLESESLTPPPKKKTAPPSEKTARTTRTEAPPPSNHSPFPHPTKSSGKPCELSVKNESEKLKY